MTWNSIIEATVSGVAAALISAIIIFVAKATLGRKLKERSIKTEVPDVSGSVLNNPFLISLSLTSFAVVLTFFSMVYSWQTFSYIYLTVADFVLGIVTYWIYNNQCPNCNRIFTKRLLNKEILKEERRPYTYRDYTIYLYADGSEKDRKYHGAEKTKMETWRTEREFYECYGCTHEWERLFERNLDLSNRPRPNLIRTKYNQPTIFDNY
ncbi:MAG: hypothetical protein HYS81_01355 [Candidatus Aenigmatarchaeota archaeon]|nr:MAG: hypothetical protein HYS81_01355 [Candidatus Aenigmarchaeota archaeon]